MKQIDNFPIECPILRIKRRLKIPADEPFDKYDSLIARGFATIDTASRYTSMSVQFDHNCILLEDSYRIESNSLSKHLYGCLKVTLLAVTIGPFLEEQIEQFKNRDRLLQSLILDAVGSECVEEAAIYMNRIVNSEIRRRDLVPTKRFSPGYGDLSLEVQRYFFSKLDLGEMGMTLTDSLLILPQKSITAFVGWRKN